MAIWRAGQAWAMLPLAVHRVDENVKYLRTHSYVSDSRHAFLVNELKLPVWESDITGSCLAASDALAELMGCTVREILGYGWVNAVPEEERERVKADWDYAIQHHQAFSTRYHFVHSNGNKVLIHGQATPVRDGDGNIVRYIGRARVLGDIVSA